MSAAAFPFDRSPTGAADDVLAAALHACAQHSVPALRRLHELTAARFLGLLVQMLGDRQEAEDLLQQCYLAIWAQASSFNPARSRPHTWLHSLIRQQAIDHLRAQAAAPADEIDAALRLADAVLGEDLQPAAHRRLRLAFLTGRSPQEIARAFGESPQAVRLGIHQALLAMDQAAAGAKLQGGAREYAAAAYALGILGSRARRRFATLLRHDISARRSWQQWDERLAGLAPELPPVRPPDDAWTRIEARIVPPPRSSWMTSRRWALLAALVLGFAVVVVLTLGRR